MFPSLASVRRTLEGLSREFDPGSLTPEQSVRAVEQLGAIRRIVEGMLGKAAKRVEDTAAHVRSGERNVASLVARAIGGTAGEARDAIETAKKLEGLPATDEAVRAGKLSSQQAKLIVGAASVNPDAEQTLLDAAAQGMVPLRDACVNARAEVEDPAARAARQRAQRFVRRWTSPEGMYDGRWSLTPEIGGQIEAALEAEVQRIFRQRRAGGEHEPFEAYAADALANLILGRADDASEPAPKGAEATVHIVISHGALMRGGAVDGEVCEIPGVGPVDVAWVRDLIGSAFLTVVIKRGKDILTVAHLGRHVPAEVQTALLVSGRECDIDGCNHRGYLERDHIHGYAKGGPTAYWNLTWLCYVHHRLKTKGWILGPPDLRTHKRTLQPPTAQAA